MRLEWRNVSLLLGETVLLNSLSGSADKGSLTAILGPSGAGKTTLLDLLGGKLSLPRSASARGELFFDGSPQRPAGAVGYVRQRDVMFGTLTVDETLRLAAELRLGSRVSAEEKAQRVEMLLTRLGLLACRHTRIGDEFVRGVSGGEKKRVAVALELITMPPLLMADEVTTGLDATSALTVVSHLRDLAREGPYTVVITIHQPRIECFNLFDKVIVLARGRTLFAGPATDAVAHFVDRGHEFARDQNPAVFLLDAAKAEQDRLTAPAPAADDAPVLDVTPADRTMRYAYKNSLVRETALLFGRAARDTLRNPLVLASQWTQYFIFGLLIGLVFIQVDNDQSGVIDRNGAMFWIFTTSGSIPVFSIVAQYPSERVVFNRERGLYRVASYHIATSLATIPMQLLGVATMVFLSYWTIGLKNTTSAFFEHLGVNLLMAEISAGAGLLCSAAAPTFDAGNTLASIVFMLMVSLSGFVVSQANLLDGIRSLSDLSFLKFGYMMIAKTEFAGATFECDLGCNISDATETVPALLANGTQVMVDVNVPEAFAATCQQCPFPTGDAFLEILDLNEYTQGELALILFGFAAFFRIGSFLVLKYVRVGAS